MDDDSEHAPSNLSRRELLRTAGLAGACVAGGIVTSESTLAAPSSVCSGSSRFCDDFQDGEYGSDWTAYLGQGDFDAQIESRQDVPNGGTNVLEISETTGGGTDGVLGWRSRQSGWDDAWTVRGLFYTENIGTRAPYTAHSLFLYYDGNGDDAPIELTLGFRDGDNDEIPFQFVGSELRESETYFPNWQSDTWYHYEASYDGTGTIAGRLWVDGDSRPSTPTIEGQVDGPLTSQRVAALRINGPSSYQISGEFATQHAFFRWQEGGPTSSDYIDDLAGADGLQADEVQTAIAQYNNNTAPNPSSSVVQQVLQRYNS